MKTSVRHLRRHPLGPALLCCLPLLTPNPAAARAIDSPSAPTNPEIAADITVNGRVVDEKGEALPGVNVVVKGGSTGTQTGSDGRYTLTAPDDATLVFSFVGYTAREEAVGGRTTIDVALSPDNKALSEVVVVGYLTQNRQDVTGSVASVSQEDVRRSPVVSVGEAIQGRLPGVTVTNSGLPGQAPNVNIRGLGTVASGSGPLYVIDGLWVLPGTGGQRDFNPQDVESVQVLKDAASLAPYGASGANGVIIITTRRGKSGPPVITANAYAGVQTIPKRWDLAGPERWAQLNNEAFVNAGRPNDRNPYAVNLPGINTDWQEEFFQRGSVQDYNLGFTGGGPNSNFNINGGYFRQKGAVVGPEFERYSLRVNTGFNRGRLRVGQSALLTRTNQTRLNGLPFIDVLRMTPVTPVYNAANPGGFGFGSNTTAVTFGTNPIAQQTLLNDTGQSNRLQGSIFGELSIFDFLRYRLNLATEYHGFFDRIRRQYGQWRQNDPLNPSNYAEQKGTDLFAMAENTLTFDKSFGEHNLTAVAGYSRQRQQQDFTRASAQGYGTGPQYFWSLDAGGNPQPSQGSSYVLGKESYFGQLTYDYDQRYLATAAVRRDGSSRFSPENRWGTFWAGSLGWRVSKEAFFQDITAVSNLKLRVSYGSLGNDLLTGTYGGAYLPQDFINPNVNYVLGGGQVIVNGSTQTQIASPDVKWEERRTVNYGVDLGFLEDRLTLSADYFVSKTTDALVNPDLALIQGNAGENPYRNIGELENKGFEFVLGYTENRNPFRYGVSANLSTLTNRVTELGTSNGRANFFNAFNDITRTEVGYELGSFYLYQFDGIYQTGEQIPAGLQAGDVRYKDLNGDGLINDLDRAHVGRVFPKLQYGVNLTAGYGAFDLAVFFQGVQGNDVFNVGRYWLDRLDENGNYRADISPWSPTNPSSTTPRAVISGNSAGNNARFNSTRWLEDGSYLRLKNLQVGFTVPKTLVERTKLINTFRIYFTGQNLFTITDYSGYDPETVGSGSTNTRANNLARGIDEGAFPNLRTFTLGLQAGF